MATDSMGLDGYMYRLVLCTHSPPHSLKPHPLTEKDRPPDKATVYEIVRSFGLSLADCGTCLQHGVGQLIIPS